MLVMMSVTISVAISEPVRRKDSPIQASDQDPVQGFFPFDGNATLMITAFVSICWVLTAVRVKEVKGKVPDDLWMGCAVPSSMNWIHFYRKEASQTLAWSDVKSSGSIWEEYTTMPSSVCFCTFGGAPGHKTGAGVATGSGETAVEPLKGSHCWRAGIYGMVSGLWSKNPLM